MALGGHRVAAASADSWDAHEKQALQPAHLAALFVPGIFGMPQDRGPEKGMSGYWLGYAQPGRNYAELAFYVGPLTLPFALLAVPLLRRRPEQSFFAVLAVFAVAIALGTPVDKALFFGLPGWSATGSPGRALVLLSLSLCVLAGIYFKEVDSEPPKLGWWLYGAAVASGAVLCAYVSVSMPEEAAQVFGKPSLVPLVLFAIPLVVVLAKRKALVLPAIAFQIAAMTAVHAGLNPGSQRGIANQPFPGMDGLKGKTIAVVDQTWSLVGPTKGVVAPPNSLLPYQIGSLSGYDSVISKTIKQRLDAINGRDSAPKANGNMLFVKPGFDPQAAADAGAQFAMSASPLDLPVVYSGENWTLYRLPSPKEAPFVVAEGYNKKVLMWSGSGRSRSQAWLDSPQGAGWEKSYLTFDYDAGTIDAVYRPHSYRAGFLLAMFAACGVTGLLCQKRPAPVR
jgi:hypothetical protein